MPDVCKRAFAYCAQPHDKLVVVLLASVFLLAVWFRVSAPSVPRLTPDSWGYLHPALSAIAGSGFLQTHGRDIAYPLFLLGVLTTTGDFQAVSVAQHAMGVFAGIVWWAAWVSWCWWLPSGLRRAFWVQCVGIVLLAYFLLNASAIFYETAIRPEGIFPALALGQIWLCLLYAGERWGKHRAVLAALSGGFSVLLALICLSVKPSWGFAAMVPFGLLLLGVFGKGTKPDVLARISPLLLAACLALAWSKLVPPAFGWIPEQSSKNFLPATLFTVHAPLVAKAVHQRLDRGAALPGEAEFLRRWEQEIEESKKVSPSAYTMLGHDPDYLMYRSAVLAEITRFVPPGGEVDYMFAAFREAALGFPVPFARKVFRQLFAAFSDLGETLHRHGYRYDSKLATSINLMDSSRLPDVGDDLVVSYAKVRSESRKLLENSFGKVSLGPGLNGLLARIIGPAFLGFWVIFWPLLAIAILLRSRRFGKFGLSAAVLAMGIIWASCLGYALTVAVVHSFDINRYLHLMSAPQSLLLAASLVVSVIWAGQLVKGRSPLTAGLKL